MTGPVVARFKVAPVLASTVATVLLLWLLFSAADIFLLLFVAVLFSLFLGAVRDWLVRRARLPRSVAFIIALAATLGAIVGLITLLVPPVVEQTQQLVGNLPNYISAWQAWLARVLARYPKLQDVWTAESGRLMGKVVSQAESAVAEILPQVVGIGHALVNVISILVMGIFLALHPATYREWLIALFPPLRRDMVRDVLADIANTLRAWIVGQVLAMSILAVLTAIGLYLLDVPYWLTFGVFTGAVAIIPFFGSLISSLLPALFVLGGDGVFGMSPGTHAFFVIVLGFPDSHHRGQLRRPPHHPAAGRDPARTEHDGDSRHGTNYRSCRASGRRALAGGTDCHRTPRSGKSNLRGAGVPAAGGGTRPGPGAARAVARW